MHPRLAELISYLDRQQRELAAAVRDIPEGERRDSPGSGRWSAVDVLEHLALIERRLAVRFTTWIAEARTAGVPAEPETASVLAAMNTARVIDRSARVTTPEGGRPTGTLTYEEAWLAFKDARAEIKRVIDTADGLALSEVVHPHPALGPLTMYEWIGFVGSHTARHAAQLVEIGTLLAAKRRWAAMDAYITERLVPADSALQAALASSTEAGLPDIQVAPNQGKLLQMLARMIAARSILEIGTLGGYSTIWLARALPADGRLITLEADPKHARVARANIDRAGFAALVEVREGLALDTLPMIDGPFDLVFIDADKPNIPDYFRSALRLTRPGGLIIVDNVVRDGAVADANSKDPSILGVRRLNDLLHSEPGVTATTLQTVGAKGYDGLTIVIKD